jgi:hypothetical protein
MLMVFIIININEKVFAEEIFENEFLAYGLSTQISFFDYFSCGVGINLFHIFRMKSAKYTMFMFHHGILFEYKTEKMFQGRLFNRMVIISIEAPSLIFIGFSGLLNNNIEFGITPEIGIMLPASVIIEPFYRYNIIINDIDKNYHEIGLTFSLNTENIK